MEEYERLENEIRQLREEARESGLPSDEQDHIGNRL